MSERGGQSEAKQGFVTVTTEGQMFAIRIARVRDVFVPKGLSTVPLAPPEVAGVLNLRGRIVTAIDLRRRLGLPASTDGRTQVAVGIEGRGELYGLLVDCIGDVLWLTTATFEANPSISIGAGRMSATAFTGWRAASWWCLTSIRCSTSVIWELLPNCRRR
ncbi:MAG: chemotaxis protein CheW [Methyloceanibacter sp.]|uniref:chemotaxis protein CheW n=1 Tax=Methyloceanibacter sp. TaxID=1965321 RepID=UPI003D9ACD71